MDCALVVHDGYEDRALPACVTFELQFAEAGLDGGRWKGAVVAFAGPESERFEHLLCHMHRQKEKLIRMLKSD